MKQVTRDLTANSGSSDPVSVKMPDGRDYFRLPRSRAGTVSFSFIAAGQDVVDAASLEFTCLFKHDYVGLQAEIISKKLESLLFKFTARELDEITESKGNEDMSFSIEIVEEGIEIYLKTRREYQWLGEATVFLM